jgi:hypothetical protein
MKTDSQIDDPSVNKDISLNLAEEPITEKNAAVEAARYIPTIPPYPSHYEGRGIVICGGGKTYFTNAWVCMNMLRHLGCNLPIELWHLGAAELDARMAGWVEPLGVRCVDALEVRKRHPSRILNAWESKPFAIIHSSFKEVLFLDADNVPAGDPTYLFDTAPYQQTGAILWPDFEEYIFATRTWRVFGMRRRYELQVESGQILIDKSKSWKPLKLCMWYNEHSDFFYQYTYGDKDTFQLAWRKLNVEYAMPKAPPSRSVGRVIYQHDFEGRKIFQHRNRDKWDLHQSHQPLPGFEHEETCVNFLNDLRSKWDGHIAYPMKPGEKR